LHSTNNRYDRYNHPLIPQNDRNDDHMHGLGMFLILWSIFF